MRTLVAIVVRLLRRLKKPSRNDDTWRGFNLLNSPVFNIDFYKIINPQDDIASDRLWVEKKYLYFVL
jgi:hypothetical protein